MVESHDGHRLGVEEFWMATMATMAMMMMAYLI
jgi:hypothetical protein